MLRCASVILPMCIVTFSGCATSESSPVQAEVAAKIAFDLSVLDDEGLQGPPDGKRALAYEFCIPDTPDCRGEVRGIDPTLEIHASSPGRIGCGSEQNLCIGSTHQADHIAVLQRLAALPYIERIQECFFE